MENEKRIPAKIKAVAWQEFEDGIVLLQSRAGMAHELNDTAAEIWRQISGEKSIEQISAEISAEFAVDQSDTLSDTTDFINELVEKGLCQWL